MIAKDRIDIFCCWKEQRQNEVSVFQKVKGICWTNICFSTSTHSCFRGMSLHSLEQSKTFWIEGYEINFVPLETENAVVSLRQVMSIMHLYLWSSFSANLSMVDFKISFCKLDRNFWMKEKGQKCLEIEKKKVLIFKRF